MRRPARLSSSTIDTMAMPQREQPSKAISCPRRGIIRQASPLIAAAASSLSRAWIAVQTLNACQYFISRTLSAVFGRLFLCRHSKQDSARQRSLANKPPRRRWGDFCLCCMATARSLAMLRLFTAMTPAGSADFTDTSLYGGAFVSSSTIAYAEVRFLCLQHKGCAGGC